MQVRHEQLKHLITATDLSPDVRDVSTVTKDGRPVTAWWWPEEKESGAPVILIHGLGGSRMDMTCAMKFAHGLGRSCHTINLRGHGTSEACLTSLGGLMSKRG